MRHLCVQTCEGQDAEGIGSCTHSDQSQIASPEIFGVDLRFQQHLAWMTPPQAPSKLDTEDPPAWSERMRGSSSMQLCGWQKKKFEAWPCSNSNFLGQLCSTFIQVSTLLPRTTHQMLMRSQFHGELFVPILSKFYVVALLLRIKVWVCHCTNDLHILKFWNLCQAIA